MVMLFTASVIVSSASTLLTSVAHKVAYHIEKITSNFYGILNSLKYAVILSSASDNDTYTFKDMLHQADVKNYVQEIMGELEAHKVRNHWSLMLRSNLPPGTKNILHIWSFKRKRYPDGRIQKYMDMICAHGGIQT